MNASHKFLFREKPPDDICFVGAGPANCAVIKNLGGQLSEIKTTLINKDGLKYFGAGTLGRWHIPPNSLPAELIPPEASVPDELPHILSHYAKLYAKQAQSVVQQNGVLSMPDTEVTKICKDEDGELWNLYAHDELVNKAKQIVLGTGASERINESLRSDFAQKVEDSISDRYLLSSEIMSLEGTNLILDALKNDQKIIIIGGSHSAFMSAWQIINQAEKCGVCISENGIELRVRGSLKLFFESSSEAQEHSYSRFSQETDICRTTGRIFRYGGVRPPARDLALRALKGDEKRLKIVTELGQASLVGIDTQKSILIQATGFRENIRDIDIFDAAGRSVEIHQNITDEFARVRSSTGRVIDATLFATGMSGPLPTGGKNGGESSYPGGLVSLNYFTIVQANIIAKQLTSQLITTA